MSERIVKIIIKEAQDKKPIISNDDDQNSIEDQESISENDSADE